jgi:hypothetical protein
VSAGGTFVLKLFATLARVAFGFALASFAAGLVMVLFVNTPAEVLAQPASRLPETASETFDLALLTGTHAAIFSAAFVLIAAGLGETFSIRSLAFYLIAGLAIALLGFAAQFSSEVAGQPTILNNYALKAFVATGSFAGFVYWLASGQFAGRPPEETSEAASVEAVTSQTAEASIKAVGSSDDDETTRVVSDSEPDAVPKKRYGSLLSRLKFQKRNTEESPSDEEPTQSDDEENASAETPAALPEQPNTANTLKPRDADA